MSADVTNVQIVPCRASWGGTDLGLTDGDMEQKMTEHSFDVKAHQEGSNVLDSIRTGKGLTLSLTLKETSLAQVKARLLASGGGSTGGTPEITTIVCGADTSGSLNNKVFFINSPTTKYAVWLNVNSAGTDPSIPGFTSVSVALATGAVSTAVADAVAAALNALTDFTAPDPGASTVTCTNANDGTCVAPDNGNSGFTMVVTQMGVSELTGWGKNKDFTSQLADSDQLILHPVAISDSDRTEDFNVWLAYPVMDSIVNSGEKEKLVKISFKVFPDTSKADGIRLFAVGDGS